MLSSGFQNVVGMSLVMGVASYAVGLIPLCMPLSRKQLSILCDLGTGILIGTALGVILPEGIEELVANAAGSQTSYSLSIGLPILLGFVLMFLLEEHVTSHGQPPETQMFDVDLEERGRPSNVENPLRHVETNGIGRAYPLSFGLIVHALVDGYALGVSASNARSPNLSFIVFLAIIVHKTPTALALTTALLASSLSVTDCKKHLLYFSLATPASTLLSYGIYAFTSGSGNPGTWSGGALLFSGGTFLYVASVMQPISGHASKSPVGEIGKTTRTILLVGGMFFPVLVSSFVVHGH